MTFPFLTAAAAAVGGVGIGAAVICVLLLILFIVLLAKPLKWIFKLLLNALSGFVALILLNFVGGFLGFALTVNLVNCLVAGFLGLPGVILLILIKYLF